MINIIGNIILSATSAAAAVVSRIVSDGLRMWLPFERTEVIGKNIYDGNITQAINGGTFTDNNDGTFTVTGSGTPNIGVGVRDFNAEYLTVGNSYKFSVQGSNTTLAVYNSSFVLLTSGQGSVEFEATTTSIKLYISPTDGVTATYSDVQIKEATQITPDTSGNSNNAKLYTGKALSFDGVNDYIDFGIDINNGGAVWTVAFGISNYTNVGSNYNWIIGHDTSRNIGLRNVNLVDTYKVFYRENGGAYYDFDTIAFKNSFTAAKRFVMSSDGTDISLYLDGQFIDSVTPTSSTNLKVSRFMAGYNTTQFLVNATTSDFQLWNTPWTTDDVTYDYANPNKLAIDNPSTSLSVTNLKGYWALSEGDGLVAYDSGSNLEEEEVENGDGSSTVGWDSLFSNTTLSINNNKLRATSDNSSAYGLSQELNLNNGSTYQVVATINVDDASGGTGNLRIATNSTLTSGDTTLSQSTGTIKTSFVASANTMYIGIVDTADAVGNYVEIDNISVREVTASNHGGILNGATYVDKQPTIPQLGMMDWSKGSNLFSYSQNFSLWNKESTVTLTPNYGTSPSGANDSTRIQMNANDSLYLDNLGSSKTFSIYVKGTQSETIRLSNGVASLFTLTGNWDRIQLYDTSASSTLYSFNTYSGATARDMEIWGAQLEDSSSASAYRLTNGGATLNSTVIPNPNNPSQDILGNSVRLREHSFNLDGTGYAEVADVDSLDFGTEAFSIDVWAKYSYLNQGSAVNVIYVNGGQSNDNSSFSINTVTGGVIRVYVTGGVEIELDLSLSDGDWFYCAITRNSSSLCTLYAAKSGEDLNSTTFTRANSIANSSNKQIGRDALTTRFYKNLIDDVRLYNRALSADEVENNYNAGVDTHKVGSSFSDDFSSDYGN